MEWRITYRVNVGRVKVEVGRHNRPCMSSCHCKCNENKQSNIKQSKARRKLNIMRKLAGTKWGANEVLKKIYQQAIRPHLEYGSSSWKTAAKCHQQSLDRVQNQALRIITGRMRSTPIEKMEHTANLPPLSKRKECQAMVQATKYESSEDHQMNTRQAQPTILQRRLKRSSSNSKSKKHQVKQTGKGHHLHLSTLPHNKGRAQRCEQENPDTSHA